MKDVWVRVKAELERREESRERPVAWLAERLDMKIQRVNNWASRGVPPSAFGAIAQALGWSIDDVAGTSTADGRPPWPFTLVSRDRWDALTERQRGYVEGKLNDALDECESKGKYPPNRGHPRVQLDTPAVRTAHSTSATGRQTPDPVWDVGMEGEQSDSTSSKAGRVASKADRGRASRTAREGGKG